ncbi:MAG: shikimate kinase [Clostridia bacterium]
MKNIAIIGMMGVGKTTIAKLLAKQLDKYSFDTDEYVEYIRGQSISKIIADYGEQTFRELEAQVFSLAVSYENVVISCGGGIVLGENATKLRECTVVYLSATPKVLADRLKTSYPRPLLSGNDEQEICNIYNQRKILYQQFADITINCSYLSRKATAQQIIEKLKLF